MSVAEVRAYADRLEREAQAQLARAQQVRDAADTIERLRDGSALTTDNAYDSNNRMSSAVAIGPSRGPVPDKDGPATKVMNELGFPNLAALAKALGERHGTVRSWNLREDGLPERVLPAIQRLREKHRKSRGK